MFIRRCFDEIIQYTTFSQKCFLKLRSEEYIDFHEEVLSYKYMYHQFRSMLVSLISSIIHCVQISFYISICVGGGLID